MGVVLSGNRVLAPAYVYRGQEKGNNSRWKDPPRCVACGAKCNRWADVRRPLCCVCKGGKR